MGMLTRQTFGSMVRVARLARQWSTTTAVRAVGLFGDPPRGMTEQTLLRIENNERRHQDPAMVARLIEVLELDPGPAWRAAFPEVAAALLGEPEMAPEHPAMRTCNDKSPRAAQRVAVPRAA